ncbi:MAG: anti-sigma factor [Phycisphaerales bacterium]|jgi:anti-sigma-K factor RskA|nr:anti-sigma factor [Phycisphaerales bacterium]
MSAPGRDIPPRAEELLAERACFGLSRDEERELCELLSECPDCVEWLAVSPHDLAAGEVAAGCPCEGAMPASLRREVEIQARAWCCGLRLTRAQAAGGRNGAGVARGEAPSRWRALALTGWMAAAACLVVVVGLALRGPGGTTPTHAERMAAAQAKGDLVRASWGPFNALDTGEAPEITGVTGEVAWSDSMQTGVMRFSGLPACKEGEQYQLWIVDAERGISQRVSGAIFGCVGAGALEVPIEPQLPIAKAAAFAVTLERAGGVVVSDMRRRVVLAAIAR